ncbi:biosynthetic arginine decarboxylase [Zooshikella ganghwensis]|uniref:biosynthetic arginine decarboxylase n=1 Tax=Zooshikella ganghwensis TaxID=202772 RepID=UPI00056E9C5B|nr:biosynthetic arginine decarboxylase [Zooshikella ganghwensis]
MKNDWTVSDALDTYNVQFWGNGYFSVSEQGDVIVHPTKESSVNLAELTADLQHENTRLPVLVRFHDILQNQVHKLCNAFNNAITQYEYEGDYVAVYPIKVNQHRQVVEGLLASQAETSVKQLGLEAGSKAELLTVLGFAAESNSVIICNGYKDREYIRLALIGERIGHQVYIVIEKISELDLILSEAADLNVTPRIGVRAKLASQGRGKWETSCGEKSKFGLSAAQVLDVVEKLKTHDALGCLQLLHFHMGSQIAHIRDIQSGLRECSRFFMALQQLGAAIKIVDVGGGLSIDYEGTRSQSNCSSNYNMQEYANNVVYAFSTICREHDLPHPRLISESGRALTAHHALLITNVIGVEAPNISQPAEPSDDAHQLLHNMWHDFSTLSQRRNDRALVEIYHDTQDDMAEVNSLFTHGVTTLQERALAEEIHFATCAQLVTYLNHRNRAHRVIIDELNEKLMHKFFVNFSLFQSLPDAWGIGQIFPILPLSGLDQAPAVRGVIQDITCDSDGMIKQYVDGQGLESTLPLPSYKADKPYLLGFFLVGAYQEILGDMHNLFGDTDSVSVRVDEQGNYQVEQIKHGDTVENMLRYVDQQPDALMSSYQRQLEQSNLAAEEQARLLSELCQGITGYTYLEE